MKIYLRSIADQLHRYSLTLEKKNLLIDKPWAMIDEELEMQKLIFKKDNELILSKNGKVTMGTWEYIPGAKSLLIDRGDDKVLFNEAFIDKNVMILKLDGTNDNFFAFANENSLPNLNVYDYLLSLRKKYFDIHEIKLENGDTLEVIKESEYSDIYPGTYVTIKALPIEDGRYKLNNNDKVFEIKNSLITNIFFQKEYVNPEGLKIIVHQRNSYNIFPDDEVFINNSLVLNDVVSFSKKNNMIIRNGQLVCFRRKDTNKKWWDIF